MDVAAIAVVERMIELLISLSHLLAWLVPYGIVAMLSSLIHCLFIIFLGGGQFSDWILIRRYTLNRGAISTDNLSQFSLDEIRTIDAALPRWRRWWLRAVAFILPATAASGIILYFLYPIGTAGFGIASVTEIGAVIFIHIPTAVMQFTWNQRRRLGLFWLALAFAGYFVPFGQGLFLIPYHYMWNLLLPWQRHRRELLTGARMRQGSARNLVRSSDQDGFHVFVSYARKDYAAVQPDVALLRNAGCEVWFDGELEPGENWLSSIAAKIVSSGAVLLFLSRKSMKSPRVADEIDFALSRGKLIVPVYLKSFNLSLAWGMRVGLLQGIFRYNLERAAYEALLLKAVLRGESIRESPNTGLNRTDTALSHGPAG